MNFLIVNDNRLVNRFLSIYLRGKGHGASSLTDFTKVPAWLDLNPCDGVLIDTGVSGRSDDGIKLCETLRGKYTNLALVMFTGFGYDQEAMVAAGKAGADGYVSKGLGPSEIYSVLMRVIHAKQSAQAS